MKSKNKFLCLLIIFSCLQFWACQDNHEKIEVEHPATVENIDGTDLSKVTLTERAMERIGLQTATVSELHSSAPKLVIPYSSIIYDHNGEAWVYTSPKSRTFIRHKIVVDYIQGENVFLNEGPPAGTLVATIGVAELYGTEFNVGH